MLHGVAKRSASMQFSKVFGARSYGGERLTAPTDGHQSLITHIRLNTALKPLCFRPHARRGRSTITAHFLALAPLTLLPARATLNSSPPYVPPPRAARCCRNDHYFSQSFLSRRAGSRKS